MWVSSTDGLYLSLVQNGTFFDQINSFTVVKTNLSGLFPDIFCYFFDMDGRELGAPPRICQNPAPGLEHKNAQQTFVECWLEA